MVKPNYKHSILNVSATFLKHYNIPTNHNGIKILEEKLDNVDHIVYILLDGLGANVVKKHLNKNDGLYKYMLDEVTSVFPPTTVAATTSVLSVKEPIENGHIGWVQYFENEDTNLIVFFNQDYYTGVQQKENLKEKYLHYDSIIDLVNQNTNIDASLYFPDFIEGGSSSFKEEIDRVLIKINNTDQSFNYLYWTEPDLSTHKYGLNSQEVKDVITGLNENFEELLNHLPDRSLVCVIADHGLTDIEEIPFHEYKELTTLLKRSPSIEPRCANFFVKDGYLEKFKETFNKYFNNDYTLYSKNEFLTGGLIGTGEQHPMINSMIGDYVAIAEENKMFIFNKSKGYLSHHAGLSSDEMMVPLIIFKKE